MLNEGENCKTRSRRSKTTAVLRRARTVIPTTGMCSS